MKRVHALFGWLFHGWVDAGKLDGVVASFLRVSGRQDTVLLVDKLHIQNRVDLLTVQDPGICHDSFLRCDEYTSIWKRLCNVGKSLDGLITLGGLCRLLDWSLFSSTSFSEVVSTKPKSYDFSDPIWEIQPCVFTR